MTSRDYYTCFEYYCRTLHQADCKNYYCRSRRIIWSRDWCDNEYLEDINLAEYDRNEEGYSSIDLMLTFGFGAGLGILAFMYKKRKEGESHLLEKSKI